MAEEEKNKKVQTVGGLRCFPSDHNFVIAEADYYKRKYTDEESSTVKSMNELISYSMLFCVKCGGTKEVVSADRRKSVADV